VSGRPQLAPAPESFDVIVVGAGPGGCAAAIGALRDRPSARVLILDRAAPGRDKVCGDGVGPDAVEELARLGLTDILRPAERVSRFRLVAPSGADVAGAPPSTPGYVVPRSELDHRLLCAAVAAGAVSRQHRVREIRQHPDRVVVDGTYTAPVLIGADGANSTVRRATGQPPNHGRHLAVAVRGYIPAPAGSDELYLRFDPVPGAGMSYAWAFPTAHATLNVGYGQAGPATSRAWLVHRAAELLPSLAVGSTRMTGHLLPLSSRAPRAVAGRVLLVGDAASQINPLSGEGIFYALATGALAGGAAAAGGDDAGGRYAAALRARFGRHHRQVRVLYPLMDRRRVVEAAVRACRRDARVFEQLLSVGLGDGTIGIADLARFAWASRRQ
jgi:geranylgeranyl reductase family protein